MACEWCSDWDGDGYGNQGCGGGDCDDLDPSTHPDATDLCDLKDNDCNGIVDDADRDDDGYFACQDCDDSNPNVHPGMTEISGNGIDDDCDGRVDGSCFVWSVSRERIDRLKTSTFRIRCASERRGSR